MKKNLLLITFLFFLVTVTAVEPSENLSENNAPVFSGDKKVLLKTTVAAHVTKVNAETKNYLDSVTSVTQKRDYLIKYKSSHGLSSEELKQEFGSLHTAKAYVSAAKVESLLKDEKIEYIELDQDILTMGESTGWNIERLNASGYWHLANGSGVKVGVLDTGIAPHDDLSIASGVSVIGGNYTDTHGHGTAVAGIISALVNDAGIVGVAPEVDVYAVKVMNSSSGLLSDAIAGLEWAMNNSIDVVNFGFGATEYSQIFKEVIDDAYDQDMVLVAPAGNTGSTVLFPAAYDKVIAVGAVDKYDDKASFSAVGSEIELVAPGVDINSTGINNAYYENEGTSFAAPHVAGVVALIKDYNSSLTNDDIRAKLRNDAIDLGDSGKDDDFGYGLVQVKLGLSDNLTLVNESYFYEIYNYSNYDTENETLTFWLNGTGTYQDVNYSEGWYLVKKHLESGIEEFDFQVDENGEIFLQRLYPEFSNDNFDEDGTTTNDGIGWAQGGATVTIQAVDSFSFDDAICIDKDGDGDSDACVFDESEDNDTCFAASADFSSSSLGYEYFEYCDTNGDCEQDFDFQDTYVTSAATQGKIEPEIVTWKNCDGSTDFNIEKSSFYVIDQKKSTCISDTEFALKGEYTSGSFVFYRNDTCSSGTVCDSAVDESLTDVKTDDIIPCRIQSGGSCNATSQCLTGLTCDSGVCNSPTTADLEIIGVEAFQVIPDVEMVNGKTGYVRVYVKNNGPRNTTALVEAKMLGQIFNPIIPNGNVKEINSNEGNVSFDFLFTPDSVGSLTITSNVSIVDVVSDPNTTNNILNKNISIINTKNLSIAFIPILINGNEDFSNFKNTINEHIDFINKTFPVPDSISISEESPIKLISAGGLFDLNDIDGIYASFKVTRLFSGIFGNDRYVGIFKNFPRGGWSEINNRNAIVNEIYPKTSAHELGHTFGLCDEYDINEWTDQNDKYFGYVKDLCPNGDIDPDDEFLDDRCINSSTVDGAPSHGCPVQNKEIIESLIIGSESTFLNNLMGSFSESDLGESNRWIDNTTYNHLLQELQDQDQPSFDQIERAILTGSKDKNGPVKINPIYIINTTSRFSIQDDFIDGNLTLRLENDVGQEIFNINFSVESSAEMGTNSSSNISHFVMVLPIENVSSFKVLNNGTLEDSINLSPNAPTVNLSIEIDNSLIDSVHNVSWTSSDIDGDNLSSAILLSLDGGANFTLLELNIVEAYYEIDPNDYSYSDNAVLKILVTDGVNTAEDRSLNFTLGKPLRAETLQTVTETPNHLFEFITLNRKDSVLDLNWSIDFGDGLKTNSTDEVNLSASQRLFVFAEHEYPANGTFFVVANSTSGNFSEFLTLSFGLVPSSLILVSNLERLFSDGFEQFFWFNITNGANSSISTNWTMDTGEGIINGTDLMNLSSNESVFVFAAHNYSDTGDFEVVATAFNLTEQSSLSLLVDIFDLELSAVALLNSTSSIAFFEANITNMLQQSLTSVNWTFDTGDSAVLTAPNLSDLDADETVFVYVQYDYSSTGDFDVNATAINGSLTDSFNQTFTIS